MRSNRNDPPQPVHGERALLFQGSKYENEEKNRNEGADKGKNRKEGVIESENRIVRESGGEKESRIVGISERDKENGMVGVNRIKKENVLVISDVHLGFEEELHRDGMYIPDQTPGMIKRILKLISDNSVGRIVINGDLKHRVPGTNWNERKVKLDLFESGQREKEEKLEKALSEIMERMKSSKASERGKLQKEFEQLERESREFHRKNHYKRMGIIEKSEHELKKVALFLKALFDVVDVVDIVPGNHDGRLQKELDNSYPTLASEPGLHFHSAEGFVVGNTGIFHGHAWPSSEVMSQDYLLMGHGHAAILLMDEIGVRNYEPCWLRAGLTEKVHERYLEADGQIILMPSFNDFFRGSPVNRRKRLLGPLFRNDFVDVENGEVVLLDGINLGKVSALKQFAVRGRGGRW